MKVAVFSTKAYDKSSLTEENHSFNHEFLFFEEKLKPATVSLAKGCDAICAFVNDDLGKETLEALSKENILTCALRCSGINNVDQASASSLGFTIMNVPAYSPYAVAEHAVGLMLTLNRKLHYAYNHVREGNFSLEGLMGFDMHQKTVGIIGCGQIGVAAAKILKGFGCRILGYDAFPNKKTFKECGIEATSLQTLFTESDIITLHCPLTPETKYLINKDSLASMKDSVMLINTSRGALINTEAAIVALKTKKIGYLGLDVYEEEASLFFEDLTFQIIKDDVFARLLTFPNVVVTSHQAFFTKEALVKIAQTTLGNFKDIENNNKCPNTIVFSK